MTISEVNEFVEQLTGRHLRRMITGGNRTERKERIKRFIDENIESLFDATKMLVDWLNGQDDSDDDKRHKLHETVTRIGRFRVEGMHEFI